MKVENRGSSISECKFFNAPEEKRETFKRIFLKKATKNPSLILPYKNFDIAKSRNKGLLRLEKTQERILDANSQLEFEIKSKTTHGDEQKLFLEKNRDNLKRIELVEVAHEIQKKNTPAKKAKFNRLNRELYGSVNKNLFNNLLREKKWLIENFEPNNKDAEKLKKELLNQKFLKNIKSRPEKTPTELMKKLNHLIKKRYECVFKLIDNDKTYDAKSAEKVLRKIMLELKFDWKVSVCGEVDVVTASVTKKTLKLPEDFNRSGQELRRLAIHEIGVHAARAINGKKNGGPILEFGTSKHDRAEEGLAALLECAVEKDFDNKSFQRISYRYLTAGFAMGVDGKKRNAVETYNTLLPFLILENIKNGEITDEIIEKSQDEAYRHVENAFRGTDWNTRGMAYLKLKIYYEGLLDNIKFFESHMGDLNSAFDLAMLGKYNHTGEDDLRKVLSLIHLNKKQ